MIYLPVLKREIWKEGRFPFLPSIFWLEFLQATTSAIGSRRGGVPLPPPPPGAHICFLPFRILAAGEVTRQSLFNFDKGRTDLRSDGRSESSKRWDLRRRRGPCCTGFKCTTKMYSVHVLPLPASKVLCGAKETQSAQLSFARSGKIESPPKVSATWVSQ